MIDLEKPEPLTRARLKTITSINKVNMNRGKKPEDACSLQLKLDSDRKCKISAETIVAIRQRHEELDDAYGSITKIASEFKMSKQSVHRIVRKLTRNGRAEKKKKKSKPVVRNAPEDVKDARGVVSQEGLEKIKKRYAELEGVPGRTEIVGEEFMTSSGTVYRIVNGYFNPRRTRRSVRGKTEGNNERQEQTQAPQEETLAETPGL